MPQRPPHTIVPISTPLDGDEFPTDDSPYTFDGYVANYGRTVRGLRHALRNDRRWVRWSARIMFVLVVVNPLVALVVACVAVLMQAL